MKKNIKKISIIAVMLSVLAVAYFFGGNINQESEQKNSEASVAILNKTENKKTYEKSDNDNQENSAEENMTSAENGKLADETKKEKNTSNFPDKNDSDKIDTTEETINSEKSNGKYTCTLSVRCDTILNNMQYLNSDKKDIIPSDGIIFAEREVVFYEDETVFNLLQREMKKNKIHMEFVNTPIYKSAYIEGIANIYELDCGELSGWMYSVNGVFPNCGSSRWKLKQGDKIEWVYTCNLGADVGGYFTNGGSQRDE